MKINLPETNQQRVVIIGGGFAGLSLARRLVKKDFQVVLIDKHNYHQFQPLFYQVAMAGLEPSSIVFPFRKLFHHAANVYVRMTEVTEIQPDQRRILTKIGHCNYDHLVIAIGADTNYYGNDKLAKLTIPMKSVSEALFLRNLVLEHYEKALSTTDYDERQGLVDIVVVGGGATGVEIAGALAEMRKYILPKDYPELNCDEVDITLIQSADQLLKGMSEASSTKAYKYLEELGVKVMLNARVTDYDGEMLTLKDGAQLRARKVIWAAGITGNQLLGLPAAALTYGNRIKVDRCNRVLGLDQVYALGDIAYMEEENFAQGHPQVAQVAIQQANHLARNLLTGKWTPFVYRNRGAMATVGRNRAVVDLPHFSFQGFLAWAVWLLVHLFAILGAKNKLIVFLNWVWNYLTYDQSLRLIIRPRFAVTQAPDTPAETVAPVENK